MPSDPAALYCFAAAIIGGLGITFGSIGLTLLQAGRDATPTERRPVKLIPLGSDPVKYVKPDRVTEIAAENDVYGNPAVVVRFVDGTFVSLPGHNPHEVAATINAELPGRSA